MKHFVIVRSILCGAMLCLAAELYAQTKSTQKSTIVQPVKAEVKQVQPVKAEVKKTQGSAQPLQSAPGTMQTQPAQTVEGIKFFDGSWASAVSKAKLEKKAIFVDAYASWCGPCKYMKRVIFTIAEVGEFYNKNFINLALDWEKLEARPLHGKYPLRAFPTLMFFNPVTEQVIAVAEGALDGSNMIAFGNYGLNMLNKDNNVNAKTTTESESTSSSASSVPIKNKTNEDIGLVDKVSNIIKDIF